MSKEASLPVRLEKEISERLDIVSQRLHLSKSAIVRMLTEKFVEHCEEHGGIVVMPPQFKSFKITEKK